MKFFHFILFILTCESFLQFGLFTYNAYYWFLLYVSHKVNMIVDGIEINLVQLFSYQYESPVNWIHLFHLRLAPDRPCFPV
jgi:hypothetical protein